MKRKTINIGMCGCGRISAAHMDVLTKLDGVRVSAYWNRPEEPGLAEAFLDRYGGDYSCADFAEIAADPSIDAVYLCTMHNDRVRFVEMFAAAGKAVFCEKPLALDEEGLAEIGRVVSDSGILFWSGYKIRFHSLFEKAMELIPDVEIVSAHVMDEVWPEGIFNDPNVAGGNVVSQGVYATESIRLLAGCLPVSVSAVARYGRHRDDVPDSLCASFEFENGAVGSITVGDAGLAPDGVSKFQMLAAGGNKCVAITD
ncbi:MAG: Gfo/Idh/MocA family oxidoreductase, partial [Victivallales bacterium]|nr:Gfo/Idh/MocA family oxidoreductase [Victivallales bacterium]